MGHIRPIFYIYTSQLKKIKMKKTLGGDRLGSGSKMQVELHNYERSTHDLSYLWRSTMSAGTLVPFMSEIALPGDTFDINLNAQALTLPTIGPLFGSFKLQLDVFQAPIRLYNSLLHNNTLGIGLNMAQIKFPTITLSAVPLASGITDYDNCQINPSCLLSYFGIRGVGITTAAVARTFNAIPILAYWEIYKNYYANKQEEIGAVLHTPSAAIVTTITTVSITNAGGSGTLPLAPTVAKVILDNTSVIVIGYSGTKPIPSQTIVVLQNGQQVTLEELGTGYLDNGSSLTASYNYSRYGDNFAQWRRYRTKSDISSTTPIVQTFDLNNIDQMRTYLLADSSKTIAYDLNDHPLEPYKWLYEISNTIPTALSSQEGLGLKTYQSDLFNNWLQTEWIDGTTGINAITAIDTSSGKFTIDTLNLSKKIYDMLNRIAVSGGSYDDWLDAVYVHERYTRCETPMYMGGLIKELVFQEVVSNSQSSDQPLGTLAGRGTLSNKHKGGNIIVKVDEPSYIIGIVSLTPRLDYSQGNKWDTGLKTIDDLHKPALDEIGFQELITEQLAWWDTYYSAPDWLQYSAGKQPAWINYMTNVNVTRGNFAIADNSMFMTLNRRYVPDTGTSQLAISDLTTYIDPSKYNNIFAQTSLDAQNFWMQIAVNITARRKMSAKVMPNL